MEVSLDCTMTLSQGRRKKNKKKTKQKQTENKIIKVSLTIIGEIDRCNTMNVKLTEFQNCQSFVFVSASKE